MQWTGGLIGLINTVVWMRELRIRPNRDVWVEMLGSVVSLHSIYLGFAVAGTVVTLAFSFPFLTWLFEKALWICEIRKRREARIVEAITVLRGLLDDSYRQLISLSSEQSTAILRCKQDLINKGIVPERYIAVPDHMWQTRLKDVLVYIIHHGVKHGVSQYEKDSELPS